ITVGAFGGMIPVLSSAVLARGSENVLRSSLFRSGYELFFTAVPRVQRRKIKPILDIGFDRFGDLLGGVLISTLLIAGSSKAIPLMLGAAALNGIIGIWVSRKLHDGYVQALENNLLNQSIHIEISDIRDSTTRTAVLQTLSKPIVQTKAARPPDPPAPEPAKRADPVLHRLEALRSSDGETVRRALREPLDATLASHAINLLAWNELADDAVAALQKIARSVTGQLTDALLDPFEEFAIRRRIPRVLSVTDSKRAFDGLAQALFDHRFEVRFQAGRALAQIQDRAPNIAVDHSSIREAVLHELAADKEVWQNRSLVDAGDNGVSNVTAEHVFRLLSLILPRDPLKNAYRGLNSGDEHWKGMALEYLESVLPGDVRKTIWPLLESA